MRKTSPGNLKEALMEAPGPAHAHAAWGRFPSHCVCGPASVIRVPWHVVHGEGTFPGTFRRAEAGSCKNCSTQALETRHKTSVKVVAHKTNNQASQGCSILKANVELKVAAAGGARKCHFSLKNQHFSPKNEKCGLSYTCLGVWPSVPVCPQCNQKVSKM